MARKRVRTHCAVPGCTRQVKPAPSVSSYCSRHTLNMYRNGHPTVRAVNRVDLAEVRPYLRDQVGLYKHLPQFETALTLADELLNFRAPNGYSYQCSAENVFAALRDAGVTRSDFLWRVLEVYAFSERHPERFPDSRVMRQALGRLTMQLANVGRWKPKRRTQEYVGELAERYLGQFALSFLRFAEQRMQEVSRLIRSAANFSDAMPKVSP